jgi:hypothetical protein
VTARRDSITRIVRGQAFTLEAYPPFLGVVDDATVRVGTPATPLPTTYSAATLDATFTATTASASEGDTTISVGSLATCSTARRYMVGTAGNGGAGDDAIEVEVQAHASVTNGAVTLSEPLPRDIPSGALFVSNRLTVDLDAGDTAAIGVVVADWTATIGGVVHNFTTEALIVERDATYTLTPTTLTQSSPYCKQRRPDSDDDFTEMIDAAWRRYVEPALLAKALRPERIVHGRFIESAHIAACEYFLAQQFDPEREATFKQGWTDALARVLANPDLWVVSPVEDLTAPPGTDPLTGQATGSGPSVFEVTFISR